MNRRRRSRSEAIARGLVSGVIGGLVASFAMSQFQAGLASLTKPAGQAERGSEQADDATVKVAAAVTESTLGHRLTGSEKAAAGPAVHYAFGATMGGLYGVLSEVTPAVSAGWGMPFATALWLAADEVAVPALGLSKTPTEYPVGTHASALAAHLVYGLSVDLVRRALR